MVAHLDTVWVELIGQCHRLKLKVRGRQHAKVVSATIE